MIDSLSPALALRDSAWIGSKGLGTRKEKPKHDFVFRDMWVVGLHSELAVQACTRCWRNSATRMSVQSSQLSSIMSSTSKSSLVSMSYSNNYCNNYFAGLRLSPWRSSMTSLTSRNQKKTPNLKSKTYYLKSFEKVGFEIF